MLFLAQYRQIQATLGVIVAGLVTDKYAHKARHLAEYAATDMRRNAYCLLRPD